MENKTQKAMSVFVMALAVFGMAVLTTTVITPTAAADPIGPLDVYNNCVWNTGGTPPVGCAGYLELDP